ncbi:MAG: hypothetical protein J0H43_03435, partial [Actinobacteria bacterium]|nr:hypothetical protein [Actinomycetota bacterium]
MMAMRAEVLPEPELEFGGGARHIDPRFGLTNYGPADLGSGEGPRAVRLGLVGDAASMDLLRTWLERCRDAIPAKDERYGHLFSEFPGCDIDRGLHAAMVCSDRASNPVSARALREIDTATGTEAIERAVESYAEEARILAEQNRVDVILIARPQELHDIGSRPTKGRGRKRAKARPTKAQDDDPGLRWANFHDLLKAELLNLGVPIQVIRRSTFDETTAPPKGGSRQDEATRAW